MGGLAQSIKLAGAIDLGGTTRTVTLRNTATLSGVVSNRGITASFNTSQTLRLNADNTYSSGTTLAGSSQDSLMAGSTNAFGTGLLAVNVGTVNLNGFTVSIGQLSGSSGATITSNVAGAAGLITNALQLPSAGLANAAAYAGTQTVSGPITYSPGSSAAQSTPSWAAS